MPSSQELQLAVLSDAVYLPEGQSLQASTSKDCPVLGLYLPFPQEVQEVLAQLVEYLPVGHYVRNGLDALSVLKLVSIFIS